MNFRYRFGADDIIRALGAVLRAKRSDSKMRLSSLVAIVSVAAATAVLGAGPAFAADGNCTVEDGQYATIQSAVDDATCTTVYVSPAQVFHENVTIGRDVDLYGAGAADADLTILAGDGTGSVVTVKAGSTVNIAGFLIRGGAAVNGGGVANAGTLTVTGSYITGSSAIVSGGGVYNTGTMTLSDVDVDTNTADEFGGGVYNRGRLTITGGTLVFQNAAGIDGGGVVNAGIVSLCGGSILSGNTASNPRRPSNFSGNSPVACPSPTRPGSNAGGTSTTYLLGHAGQQRCLPDTALAAHVRHGDTILGRGC